MAEEMMNPIYAEPTNTVERVSPEQKDVPNPVSVPTQGDDMAIVYCIGGILAMIAAWFAFAIPLSLLAIHLGRKGVAAGSTVFGQLVVMGGWLFLILSVITVVFA